MDDKRRGELVLGRLEQKAHRDFPRHAGFSWGRVGHSPRRNVPGGVLRVAYGDSFRWQYELNGLPVTRRVALQAFKEPGS